MGSTPLFTAALAVLLFAAPSAQGVMIGRTDIQLRFNGILQFEDPEEGADPSSEGDFTASSGFSTGFARFDFLGGFPPRHLIAAEITLTQNTTDSFASQSFTEWKQGFGITDFDSTRTGPVSLRAEFNIDWNLEFRISGGSFANAFVSYEQYDGNGDFVQSFGSFSCSSLARAAPSCFGGPGWDLSGISINFNGTSYDIVGTAAVNFNAGWVNTLNNYFGPGFGTSVSLNGGNAGDYNYYGAGNVLDWSMTSPESSVTVTPIPEPASAGLVALGLLAMAARRRSRRARQPTT